MKKQKLLLEKEYNGDILDDVCQIIDTAQKIAHSAVNVTLVQRNWLLGKRIHEEEMKGENRAEYGKEVIKRLSIELTEKYGKGYTFSSIYKFVKFYKCFPNILDSMSTKFNLLSWTHYRILLQVDDEKSSIVRGMEC